MTTKPKAKKTAGPAAGKAKTAKGASNARANLKLLQGFAEAIKAMAANPALPERAGEEAALYEAQELVFEAWDAPTARQRVALAKKALKISPRCADALTILAENEAPRSDEALALYRKAVAAGEAAIGPDDFEDMAGQFWGFIETRPYMRAREALARCLRQRGETAAAAGEYRAMLELNPNDNQGIRYELMSVLQSLRASEELSALLERYPEDSAFWTYTDALAAFRREGDTKASAKRLRKAVSSNRHVPPFLLGARKIPGLPDYYSPGDVTEAVIFAEGNVADWVATEGALAWLAAHSAAPARRPRAAKTKS